MRQNLRIPLQRVRHLAVLTDVEQGYHLDGRYRLEPVPGNSLTLEYRVVKLLDLEGRVASSLHGEGVRRNGRFLRKALYTFGNTATKVAHANYVWYTLNR